MCSKQTTYGRNKPMPCCWSLFRVIYSMEKIDTELVDKIVRSLEDIKNGRIKQYKKTLKEVTTKNRKS